MANAQGQVSYTSQSTTNIYNASGQRIRKVENGATTKYFYSGSVNLFTTNENNVLLTENILDLSGSIIASLRFEDENPNTPDPYAGKYFFFNYDVRGSTTAILQPDGAMVKGYEYDVFGSLSQSGATDFLNEVTFTGSVSDLSSGLQYMNARFYNPSTGRFLSQDSYSGNAYDPWTQHLYSYSGNNPVNMIDPTGHFFNLAAGLIGAAIGGVAGVLGNGIANVINGQDFFENSGSALLGGVITGLAAGVTCGASLIATGAGMLAVTGVTGLGMVSTAAGAYGISSMAASAATQAIEKGPQNIDTGEIMLSGAIGALTAAVFTGVGEVVKAVRGSSNSSAKGSSQVSNEQSKQGGGRTPSTRLPGKTIDQATGQEVGRFIVDPKGNVMIEPIGGSTVPAGRGGVDTHTLYPNGSNYQRLNPIGHGNNPSAHGHGHLMGSGFGMKGQGPSIDIFGNIVPWSSASAHWPINK